MLEASPKFVLLEVALRTAWDADISAGNLLMQEVPASRENPAPVVVTVSLSF